MNRRNFLQGLAAIVPATLLAKLALPQVEATVEAVEEIPVMTFKEREFKASGGYFCESGRIENRYYFVNGVIHPETGMVVHSMSENEIQKYAPYLRGHDITIYPNR